MIRLILPAFLLLATGAAAAPGQQSVAERQQARLDKALNGLTPGEPTRCIQSYQFNSIETFEDTILYKAGRNRLYRNTTNGSCAGLRRGDLVVTRTFNGQYCAGDIVETRSRTGGFISGICALGEFVPYRREPRK